MLDVPKKILGLQLKAARRVAEMLTGRGGSDAAARTGGQAASGATGPISAAPSMRDGTVYDPVAPAAEPVAGSTRVRVSFEGLGVVQEVEPGTTILEAALAAEVDLNHYCGGMASCGSCRIEIVEGLDNVSAMDPFEAPTLDMVKENPHDRLGCQTRILGAVTIRIPPQD